MKKWDSTSDTIALLLQGFRIPPPPFNCGVRSVSVFKDYRFWSIFSILGGFVFVAFLLGGRFRSFRVESKSLWVYPKYQNIRAR